MRLRFVGALCLALLVTHPALRAESAAGIRWTAPTAWRTEAPRPMRAATYTIPSPQGGPAECVVNFFGPGQGGSVSANVERWASQMLGSGGKPAAAKVTTRTVRGIKVTVVDTAGAYTGMGGPMAAGGTPVPGYRLLGAIVEAPQGTVFFKLTGPAPVVAAQQAGFDGLLASIQPQ
jgi:hypothetical protein